MNASNILRIGSHVTKETFFSETPLRESYQVSQSVESPLLLTVVVAEEKTSGKSSSLDLVHRLSNALCTRSSYRFL